MSLFGLRGRKFFDALQNHPSFPSRIRLPCPPYENPAFWDRLYKDMTYDMVNEWGDVDLSSALLQFSYQRVPISLLPSSSSSDNNEGHDGSGDDSRLKSYSSQQEIISATTNTTTFANWMDVTQLSSPEEAIERYKQHQLSNIDQDNNNNSSSSSSNNNTKSNNNEAILILGCGNSKLGEQLLINSFIGPIYQLDISSKLIQLMTQRYQKYLSETSVKRMEFIVDDATTGLTSLEPECVGGGVVDKGLLDVLHCAEGRILDDDEENDDDVVRKIMKSVHNVLQPSRPFIFFSRSEPQWMLRRALGKDEYTDLVDDIINSRGSKHYQQQKQQHRRRRRKRLWKDIEVVKLVDYDLLLYKVVKAEEGDNDVDVDTEDAELNSVITRRSYLKRLKGAKSKQ
jgi:hypothetical protein